MRVDLYECLSAFQSYIFDVHQKPIKYSSNFFVSFCLQRDEEEAAKVYEEFVKDFGGADNDDPGKKAFVRGGVIQPGQPTTVNNEGGGGGGSSVEKREYVPPLAPPPPRDTKKIAAAFEDDDDDDDDNKEEIKQQLPLGRGNKPRRMDILLENMKK